MKDRYFIDTNILIYTFDNSDSAKQESARGIINHAISSGKGIISSQIVQEFLNVVRHKFSVPMTVEHCHLFFSRVLEPICQIYISTNLIHEALDISQRWQYRFYDSLVIAAALEGECKTLYSEDLQSGQVIKDLTIENPFG